VHGVRFSTSPPLSKPPLCVRPTCRPTCRIPGWTWGHRARYGTLRHSRLLQRPKIHYWRWSRPLRSNHTSTSVLVTAQDVWCPFHRQRRGKSHHAVPMTRIETWHRSTASFANGTTSSATSVPRRSAPPGPSPPSCPLRLFSSFPFYAPTIRSSTRPSVRGTFVSNVFTENEAQTSIRRTINGRRSFRKASSAGSSRSLPSRRTG
jgi:hypothetical protein